MEGQGNTQLYAFQSPTLATTLLRLMCMCMVMVISKSGKRPHLKLPKKNGGTACDDDCPQYKSASLRSPAVAAALHNEQLTQLVLSYKKVERTPNLTKLATSEMPKGRGRKGGKAPVRRKVSVH